MKTQKPTYPPTSPSTICPTILPAATKRPLAACPFYPDKRRHHQPFSQFNMQKGGDYHDRIAR